MNRYSINNTATTARVNPAKGKPAKAVSRAASCIFTPTAHIADPLRYLRPLAVLNDGALALGEHGIWECSRAEHASLDLLTKEAQAAIGLDALCRLERIRRAMAAKNPAGQNSSLSMTCCFEALDRVLSYYEEAHLGF